MAKPPVFDLLTHQRHKDLLEAQYRTLRDQQERAFVWGSLGFFASLVGIVLSVGAVAFGILFR